ncbi:MAG: glycosyltransferase [Pseudomonadota bacterium]
MLTKQPRLLIVVKGYPRLSETFIAQEFLGLQNAGLAFEIVSLRHPYDKKRHPVHDQITAPVTYLPEYLHDEPLRVVRATLSQMAHSRFWTAMGAFLKDLRRDITPNRVRRFGQALVLAHEARSGDLWLHSHFAHTPASVARYASILLDVPFTISAHAKDIWTSPDWDLTEKMNDARWTVTCTASGRDHLQSLAPAAPVHLQYHGLDLHRFPSPEHAGSDRDGSDPGNPVRILSVGRAVQKKGYDTILAALAGLPETLHWRFEHVGGGPELDRLQTNAADLGIDAQVTWHGQLDQKEVLDLYHGTDIFTLASRGTSDGDRDGLPNVLVEAASQRLACVATAFSAIPEFFEDGKNGLLVPPEDPTALSSALARAIADPELRKDLGTAAETKVREEFDFLPGIARLKGLFEAEWDAS